MSSAARVAIVHYHLRLGGVTRVIQNAVRALASHDIDLVILHGDETPYDTFGGRAVRVPELDYAGNCLPDDLYSLLTDAATGILGSRPDAWHIHNYSLGKNLAVAGLVDVMARRGERLLLQIHDFPEDGRPGNYRGLRDSFSGFGSDNGLDALYPRAAHVHYALLNSRDRAFMIDAGATQTHLLPNPVDLGKDVNPGSPGSPDLILYPTRSIRRKNLGEFLLWSALAEPGQRYGVTLAPDNPEARTIYDRWVQVAEHLDLPVTFNLAAAASFPDLVVESTLLATTSVAEGFGLAFLEPWTMGRPLAGRNLPEITDEFVEAGVDLASLYDAVYVPLEWIGCAELQACLETAMTASFHAYGKSLSDDAVERARLAACEGDTVDFGRLSEPLQEKVLSRLCESTESRSLLKPCALATVSSSAVTANAAAIREHFSPYSYGCRLAGIYEALVNAEVETVESLSSDRLLQSFLQPERFNLLRT